MSRSRFKRKGKQKFLMIESYIFKSAAWRALTPVERAAYLEVKWRYDGLNNGRIGLGVRELSEALQTSKDTANRALIGLIDKGLTKKAKASGFNMKNRMATELRLTEYRCDVTGELPTKEFMRWQPAEKAQSDRKDVQSDRKDNRPPKILQNSPHSPMRGTVRPISGNAQSDWTDTYSITMGGTTDAA